VSLHDEPLDHLHDALNGGVPIGRAALRRALMTRPSRGESIALATRIVELIDQYPASFDGPLKRDRPLVADLLSGTRGVGPYGVQRVLEAARIDRRAELSKLSSDERTALAAALRMLGTPPPSDGGRAIPS
jgi:hypothetical protein